MMRILPLWRTVLFIVLTEGLLAVTHVEQRTLLLIRSRTNTTLSDVWNTVGGINDPNGDGYQRGVHERIFEDFNFRSSLVDEWNETNCPDNVLMIVHNKYGDELCSMYFDTQNSSWFFDSWLTESGLISWSYRYPMNAKFQKGRPYFDMYVSNHTHEDTAWMAVGLWNSSFPNLTSHTPMFLCSSNHDKPNLLMEETISTQPTVPSTSQGCYPHYNTDFTLVLTDTTAMTVEMCISMCVSLSTVYAFLEGGDKCNCGDTTGSSLDSPGHCGGGCVGNQAQICGTTDGYLIAYPTLISPGQSSGTNMPGDSYIGIPKPTMSTEYHSTVTRPIAAGQWNVTIDFSTSTSFGSPFYIRAVELVYKDGAGATVTSSYSVWYQIHPTEEHYLATTFDENYYTQLYPTNGTLVDLDVLQIWNMTFAFRSTPVDGEVVIKLYSIGDDDFVTGHMLTIWSFKSIELTTPTEETTTEAITTTTEEITTTMAASETTTENETTTTTASETTTKATTTNVGQTSTGEITTEEITTTVDGADTSTIETTTLETTVSESTSNPQSTTTLAESLSSLATDSTTGVSTTAQSVTNVTDMLCQCMCVNTFINMTQEQLQETLEELKEELTVPKTELSSYKRKFISAPDSRQSAASIGYVGVLVIAFVFGSIITCDSISVYHFFKKKNSSVTKFS
ncbi:mucin-22-like isoform X2 [Argopecten irradians]|uniref:mucin-22-like isoform X2 n=1 Tax=Argopecten irradians TaxID=31199 RepID=UPI003717B51E